VARAARLTSVTERKWRGFDGERLATSPLTREGQHLGLDVMRPDVVQRGALAIEGWRRNRIEGVAEVRGAHVSRFDDRRRDFSSI